MFDYVDPGMDRVTIIFYCGCIPFGVAWIIHNSLLTGFLLEAYIITCGAFILNPFEMEKQYVRKRWYWRIMVRAGAIVHPVLLVCLWFLDKTYPAFVTGTGTVFLMAIVVCVVEIVILGETVKRFQPDGS